MYLLSLLIDQTVLRFLQGSSDHVDPLEDRLLGYPWYLGKKSRIDAEQALYRMQDGVFLIRQSDVRPGEYAIALKWVIVVFLQFLLLIDFYCRWNRMPKHIKVSKHADTRKFYVSDVCEFLSVEVSNCAELNMFYSHACLLDSRNWWLTISTIHLVQVFLGLIQRYDTLIVI